MGSKWGAQSWLQSNHARSFSAQLVTRLSDVVPTYVFKKSRQSALHVYVDF
jgi:hypothetical protein